MLGRLIAEVRQQLAVYMSPVPILIEEMPEPPPPTDGPIEVPDDLLLVVPPAHGPTSGKDAKADTFASQVAFAPEQIRSARSMLPSDQVSYVERGMEYDAAFRRGRVNFAPEEAARILADLTECSRPSSDPAPQSTRFRPMFGGIARASCEEDRKGQRPTRRRLRALSEEDPLPPVSSRGR